MTSRRKIIVPRDTADFLSSKVSFCFGKGFTLRKRNSRALTKGNLSHFIPSHLVRRNKMLWQQERTQLSILNIDFSIENKTQTKQTKRSVTVVFVITLTWIPQVTNRLWHSSTKSSLMHAAFLCRAEPYLQLPFLLRCIKTLGRTCWR